MTLYPGDFFYMHSILLTHMHVLLPFYGFIVEVLRILNIAPTQFHPNVG